MIVTKKPVVPDDTETKLKGITPATLLRNPLRVTFAGGTAVGSVGGNIATSKFVIAVVLAVRTPVKVPRDVGALKEVP